MKQHFVFSLLLLSLFLCISLPFISAQPDQSDQMTQTPAQQNPEGDVMDMNENDFINDQIHHYELMLGHPLTNDEKSKAIDALKEFVHLDQIASQDSNQDEIDTLNLQQVDLSTKTPDEIAKAYIQNYETLLGHSLSASKQTEAMNAFKTLAQMEINLRNVRPDLFNDTSSEQPLLSAAIAVYRGQVEKEGEPKDMDEAIQREISVYETLLGQKLTTDQYKTAQESFKTITELIEQLEKEKPELFREAKQRMEQLEARYSDDPDQQQDYIEDEIRMYEANLGRPLSTVEREQAVKTIRSHIAMEKQNDLMLDPMSPEFPEDGLSFIQVSDDDLNYLLSAFEERIGRTFSDAELQRAKKAAQFLLQLNREIENKALSTGGFYTAAATPAYSDITGSNWMDNSDASMISGDYMDNGNDRVASRGMYGRW